MYRNVNEGMKILKREPITTFIESNNICKCWCLIFFSFKYFPLINLFDYCEDIVIDVPFFHYINAIALCSDHN